MEKIAAPIDNKNLMEDPLEDEVFCDGFMQAYDHRDGSGTRHLIGTKDVVEDGVVNETGLVDVRWKWGDNCVYITLLAVSGCANSNDWEYTRRHIFDDYRHIRKEFEHAYALNVISVNEQYESNKMPDENSYEEDFEAYRKKGRDIWVNKNTGLIPSAMPWPQFRYMMMNFFGGVMYQIENDYAGRAVSELFYRCIVKLFEQEINDVPHIWSEIDLDKCGKIQNS